MNRITFALASLAATQAFAQTTLYVKSGAPAGGDGLSWATAMNELKSALDAAALPGSPVIEVWVTGGTYRPDPAGLDRTQAFKMRSGLRVLGGFIGTETSRRDRNWSLNRTTLTGDYGAIRSYHIVRADNVSADSLLDGFEIIRGQADGAGVDSQGGGIRIDASSLQVSDCIIRGNAATNGGGVYVTTGSPLFVNCMIEGNLANSQTGGVYISPQFVPSFPSIINCTVANNSAVSHNSPAGITMASVGGMLKLRNSIIYGNDWVSPGHYPDQTQGPVDVAYCIESESGVWPPFPNPPPNCINASPRFVYALGPDGFAGTADDDLHLAADSPAIDSGDAASIPLDTFDLNDNGFTTDLLPLDLASWPRRYDDPNTANTGTSVVPVDMGAYEGPVFIAIPSVSVIAIPEGTTIPLTVRLSRPPLSQISLACVTIGDPDLSANPPSLTFDTSNWQTPQPLSVSAAEDPDAISNTGILSFQTPGLSTSEVALSEIENDAPPGVVYVKLGATGNGQGTSWANAFPTLQGALTYAASTGGQVHELWVAAGTYHPQGFLPTETFQLQNGLAIYGGFNGTEISRDQRNWTTNLTILTADLGGDDEVGFLNYEENRLHIVTATNVNNTARLDGFVVKDGWAFSTTVSGGTAGGGLNCLASSPVIANTTFDSNWSRNKGGAAYCTAVSGPGPSFINCKFVNNRCLQTLTGSVGEGAGIYVESGCPITIQGCTFDSNTSILHGAVTIYSSALNMSGSLFTGNILRGAGGIGDGMWIQQSAAPSSISNCEFRNHVMTAGQHGGGLAVTGLGSLQVTNCNFHDNQARFGSGAYLYSAPGLTSVFDGCTFTNNSTIATGASAGLGADGNCTVRNSTFTANSGGTGGAGGALSLATFLVENCVFMNNTSSSQAGAASAGLGTWRNCTFDGNTCTGTSSQSGAGALFATGPVYDCTFTNNRYTGQGGNGGGAAQGQNGSNAAFIRCVFRANTSTTRAGATVLGADFVNCIFTGNTAVTAAGACDGPGRMVNCQFTGNSSQGQGGAVFASGTVSLKNCSLAGNSALSGGGVYLWTSGTLTIDNSILWGNTQTAAGSLQNAQIFTSGGSATVAFQSSFVQGWAGTLTGTATTNTDPLFLNPRGPDNIYGTADDSLALAAGSPAIDSGNNTRLPVDTFDLDGDANVAELLSLDLPQNPRQQDDPATANTGVGTSPIVDRGAFEYVPVIVPCYANCDGSTATPLLTANDFQCFLNAYSAGNPYANCDGSVVVPVLTANDFQCFLNAYAAGCSR